MADPSLIDSLNVLAAKLDALLVEARATRELLQGPRPAVRAEAIPTSEAAQILGCSIRRVEQLLSAGLLDRGHRYGKRGTITIASIERALRTVESARPRPAERSSANADGNRLIEPAFDSAATLPASLQRSPRELRCCRVTGLLKGATPGRLNLKCLSRY